MYRVHVLCDCVAQLILRPQGWGQLHNINSTPTPTPEVSTPTPNSGQSPEYQLQLQLQLRRFQLQLQLQLRPILIISTPTPTPTPEVSTPIPTPTPEFEIQPQLHFKSNPSGSTKLPLIEVQGGLQPNQCGYGCKGCYQTGFGPCVGTSSVVSGLAFGRLVGWLADVWPFYLPRISGEICV